MMREHPCVILIIFKLFEICFMAQNMINVGAVPHASRRMCIPLLLGGVSHKCQSGLVS